MRVKKGKKDEHFTACWENKELLSKLILSTMEFSRFFFTVVITRFEYEKEQTQILATQSACSADATTPLEEGIRATVAKIEDKKCILALQDTINHCSLDDKIAASCAAQDLEQAHQATIEEAKHMPLTLREDSKTRLALSLRAGYSEEMKPTMIVRVGQHATLHEWALPADAAFDSPLVQVRECAKGNPYRIVTVTQTTTEPMGLRLETISPTDGSKIFIMACKGRDRYVDLWSQDDQQALATELTTFGQDIDPAAKSAPKMQATAKVHLAPRQPQHPPPQDVPQDPVDIVVDSPTGRLPTTYADVAKTTLRMGGVLDPLAPWQQKPEPKEVVGCRDECDPEVQAASDNGEDFVEMWFASAHRVNPHVYGSDIRKSKSLTKLFRHFHHEMSNREIVKYEDMAAYIATTWDYENYAPDEWERLIRQNMRGMAEKPRMRWAFHVPRSHLEYLSQPCETPNMIFMRGGTSKTPNDWWMKDTLSYYGMPSKATIIQGASGNRAKTHDERLEIGQQVVRWQETPILCHGTDLKNWNGIWKHGVLRGGPHAKRNEIHLKLPENFRLSEWGKYQDWIPTIYQHSKPCVVHIDTEVAQS